LFSQDAVADFINANFEPAWEMVRPVPMVRIDFGNGTVLTRTLHGNILTSVCTADGKLLDALPGIYTEAAYVDRLDQFRLLARYVASQPSDQRAARLRDYHQRQAEALKKNETPERFVLKKKVAPLTKAAIERPVEVVLQAAPPPPAAKEQVKAPASQGMVGCPPRVPVAPPVAVEDVGNWKELAEDTALNESTRRLQIHQMLAEAGLVAPEKVTRAIYKEVLHADLDDPYLGLGKVLFDSYPFAKEDGAR
jgi:hypothetical protein